MAGDYGAGTGNGQAQESAPEQNPLGIAGVDAAPEAAPEIAISQSAKPALITETELDVARHRMAQLAWQRSDAEAAAARAEAEKIAATARAERLTREHAEAAARYAEMATERARQNYEAPLHADSRRLAIRDA